MIYGQLIHALRSFDRLTELVGQNDRYPVLNDRLVIRAGNLDEDDPYPGVVLALPSMQIEGDLAFRGGFAVTILEVRAISLSLSSSWAIAKAAAWNGQDPDDTARLMSGLDGYQDLTRGLQSIVLKSITEDPIAPEDKSDRRLWVVESSYEVHFDIGTMLRLEN